MLQTLNTRPNPDSHTQPMGDDALSLVRKTAHYTDTPLVTLFELLPSEVHVLILKLIVKRNNILDLVSLIRAFPDTLAQHVLVITDSRTSPYRLLKAPECASIHVLDFFNNQWSSLRTIPIRVLSFSELEDSAVTSELLLDASVCCPYARFMSSETPVLIETYSEDSLVYKMISPLMRYHGVPSVIHYRKRNGKTEYLKLDGSKGLANGIIRLGDDSGSFVKTPTKASNFESARIVDILCPKLFSSQYELPNAQTLRIMLNGDCRPAYSTCMPKLIDISNFTGLENLYVSFEDLYGPSITFPPAARVARHGHKKATIPVKAGESFHFINRSWSFQNPYGRSHCEHMIAPFSVTCQAKQMRPFFSTGLVAPKCFKMLNVVGIPDWELPRLLGECEELRWKRLCYSPQASGGMKSLGDFELIVAPKLTRLTVFSEVHLGEKCNYGMNPFCASNITVLALFALPHSTSAWDLKYVFHKDLIASEAFTISGIKNGSHLVHVGESLYQAPSNLKTLHLGSLAVSSVEVPTIGLEAKSFRTTRRSLEELYMTGYAPNFCMSSSVMNLADDIVFEKLQYIRIDISSTPRQDNNIDLYFLQVRFPVLQTLCLDLFNESNVSGQCPGVTTINIVDLPMCLQTISINTLIHSRTSIMGNELMLPRVPVRHGVFSIWKSNGAVFQFSGTHLEKPYREWVYSQ